MSSMLRPPKTKSVKCIIRHFAPAWFAAIMGTGAISILFFNFPYATGSIPLKTFTYIFFILNLILFSLFSLITIARYVLFPDIWTIMIRHPVQSLYLGCYPMGATTLINIGLAQVYETDKIGGKGLLYVLWACWWICVALSFMCAIVLVHIMKTKQDHAFSRMSAIWLLPVVTLIVSSSTGGILAPALLPFSTTHALVTLTVSACMVSIGLALAFMILTAYYVRLICYGLPPGPGVMSVFVPLGPMGQGGYSILLLGKNLKNILPIDHGRSEILQAQATGATINVICLVVAVVLWALASMWMLFAMLALLEVLPSSKFPFRVPFWGLIFPNGVYANLTIQLYVVLDSSFFRVWGSIYSAFTLTLWCYVFLQTVRYVWNGEIFEAPCLDEDPSERSSKASAPRASCIRSSSSRSYAYSSDSRTTARAPIPTT
ncbi:hypothetical protein K474DRAFT_1681654 [Panus rudis PR-1116 ss-1]|nr:hypothetical protein K474DRAFT_1681654 [Panus rudis PR-1116 ss-1]